MGAGLFLYEMIDVTTETIAQQIIEHYNRYDEDKRLKGDIGPLEFARTQELILRYLPPAPAVIVDAGGATGVYSFWLAGLGYKAHLVDIVPRHIEQAAQTLRCPALLSLRACVLEMRGNWNLKKALQMQSSCMARCITCRIVRTG